MALVLRLTGKAKQVFQMLALLARHRGQDTLGQIIAEQEGKEE